MAKREPRSEAGASLILAMIFMSVVSLISLAMAAWATTGLHSTISFTAAQSTVSTANSLAEVALQETRHAFYTNTLWAQPPVSCWGVPATDSPSTWTPANLEGLNNSNLYAYCSTVWPYDGTSTRRQVTISICPTSFSPTQCAATPYLQVVAKFDDRPASGSFADCSNQSTGTPGQGNWSTCGTYMTINSWVFATVPPTVTVGNGFSLGTTNATCTTTDSFTLAGTGFISGSTTVYFISVTTSGNQSVLNTLEGTSITVSSGSLLTGCIPANTPSTADVIVATPVGTSSQVLTVTGL